MHHVTKTFGKVVANKDVNLELKTGEILALLGENGSGKTTLMNMLSGIYFPDHGEIFVKGREVTIRSPKDSFALGIGMIHQHFKLVDVLTAAENIVLGLDGKATVNRKEINKKVAELAKRYGFEMDPAKKVYNMSVSEKQTVEILKVLYKGADILILDEPTAVLTPQETDELIDLLKRMKNELSIIFISHKLNEVKSLSDKIAILRHGKVVFSGSTDDYSPRQIAAMMTGHEITLPENKEQDFNGETALSIKNLCVRSDRGFLALDGFSLDVRQGEIVGLAGVSGNGQRELAEAINGLRNVESGSIDFFGTEIAGRSASFIISQGMGYIPEERNVEGIVPSFPIKENFILKDSDRPPFAKHRIISRKAVSDNAEELRKSFDIRCPGVNTPAGSLSGGNIQKVILARELTRSPKFLLAVYPTRGLDMGAIEFIHQELLKKRREGIGILLISEELEELMNLSDRIAVIYKGRIQKVLNHGEANKENLGILMAGLKEEDDNE